MRTHLFRGAMALAVLLTVSAVPALAQSVVRGKVVDAQGKAVADATVLFEATDANRKTQTKTDKNGEFLQVGLSSGSYKVTASKDGVGSQTLNSNVRQGPNNPLSFSLTTSSNLSNADKEAAVALQTAAAAAMEAMRAAAAGPTSNATSPSSPAPLWPHRARLRRAAGWRFRKAATAS